MRNVDEISKQNYYLFIDTELTRRQKEVYDCFDKPLTSEDVANKLGKGLNVISGRITELRESGYLAKLEQVKNSKGNPCWLFKKIK